MARVKRFLRIPIYLLALAIAITVLVSWGCSAIDVFQSVPQSAQATVGDYQWTVQRWDRPGAIFVISDGMRPWPWGASQATGAPDTAAPGDQTSAWASATADGQREWLVLEYANAIPPKSVRVYENYCPGAVDRVTVFDADDREVQAWAGQDPTPATAASGVSEIAMAVDFPVKKLKLYINSPAVTGWNEIDAVALVSKTDQVQWASKATASSSYSPAPASPSGAGAVKALLPSWGSLADIDPSPADPVRFESRAVDARGWPLPALWSERDPITGNAVAGAIGAMRRSPASSNAAIASPPSGSSSFVSMRLTPLSPPPKLSPAFPIRIIWPAFLADIAFYAIGLGILTWLAVRPWRLVLEVSRLRNGCCIACGYDLGYNFQPGCPECGWRRIKSGEKGA